MIVNRDQDTTAICAQLGGVEVPHQVCCFRSKMFITLILLQGAGCKTWWPLSVNRSAEKDGLQTLKGRVEGPLGNSLPLSIPDLSLSVNAFVKAQAVRTQAITPNLMNLSLGWEPCLPLSCCNTSLSRTQADLPLPGKSETPRHLLFVTLGCCKSSEKVCGSSTGN